MPKYMPKGCKCASKKRYVSSGIANYPDCIDVCTAPICGTADNLTLLAPVVYDEIGINLCREVPLTGTLPTAGLPLSASVQVLTVSFAPQNGAATSIERIPGRPNCYLITLTNLAVTFAVTIYDCSKRTVSVLTETATYLASGSSVPDYQYHDEDTNPSNVELEIFAPYGLTYQDANTADPAINYIGFSTTNNTLQQGLNMIAIPKILNFDTTTPSLTVGITFYIKSVYFSQYLIPHNGRAVVPKGSVVPDEDSVCLDFVSGDLLDYEIKPLELGPPKYEENLKNECSLCEPCNSCYNEPTEPAPVPPAETPEN